MNFKMLLIEENGWMPALLKDSFQNNKIKDIKRCL
jgi:hypothetical protein